MEEDEHTDEAADQETWEGALEQGAERAIVTWEFDFTEKEYDKIQNDSKRLRVPIGAILIAAAIAEDAAGVDPNDEQAEKRSTRRSLRLWAVSGLSGGGARVAPTLYMWGKLLLGCKAVGCEMTSNCMTLIRKFFSNLKN